MSLSTERRRPKPAPAGRPHGSLQPSSARATAWHAGQPSGGAELPDAMESPVRVRHARRHGPASRALSATGEQHQPHD